MTASAMAHYLQLTREPMTRINTPSLIITIMTMRVQGALVRRHAGWCSTVQEDSSKPLNP